MFFTCKNSLVCALLTYRLVVIQLERCRGPLPADPGAIASPAGAGGRMSLLAAQQCRVMTPDQFYKYATRVSLSEPTADPAEPDVEYVIHHRVSVEAPDDEDDEVKVRVYICIELCSRHAQR